MAHQTIGKLAVWNFDPPKVAKARILLIHGISEHSGRHQGTVDALLEQGYSVVRFDLRGAGHSGGRRQWVEKFQDYVDDTAAVYRWICRELEPLPLYLLGHSMGGLVALHFIPEYQRGFKGLILSAPAYKTGNAINPLMIAVGRKLVHFVPTLKVPGSRDKSAISRDPEAVRAFLEDPLCCHTNTLNQGNQVLDALLLVAKLASLIELPTLLIHGTHDKIIRLEGSFEILQALKSQHKTFIIRPGGYHEAHNDIDKAEYFTALHQWLAKELA